MSPRNKNDIPRTIEETKFWLSINTNKAANNIMPKLNTAGMTTECAIIVLIPNIVAHKPESQIS
jgi:hypothetical protein